MHILSELELIFGSEHPIIIIYQTKINLACKNFIDFTKGLKKSLSLPLGSHEFILGYFKLLMELTKFCVQEEMPFHAFTICEKVIEQYPLNDEFINSFIATRIQIKKSLDAFLFKNGLTGDDRFELAILYELVILALADKKYDQALKMALDLQKSCPNFIKIKNEISLIYFATGDINKAISTLKPLLKKEPENYYFLANMTRFLYRANRIDEAYNYANQLFKVETNDENIWNIQAEALSYINDNLRLEKLFQSATEKGILKKNMRINIYLFFIYMPLHQ